MTGGNRFAALIATLFLMSPAYSGDCSDILEQGIRNTYSYLSTKNVRSLVQDGFCSSEMNLNQGGKDGGVDLSIPIGDRSVGFDGTYTESELTQIQKNACSFGSKSLNDDQYTKVLQAIADPNVVNAWALCQKERHGLLLTGKLFGSKVFIDYEFRASGSKHSTEVTLPVKVSGATCGTDVVTKGTVISSGVRLSDECTRC